MNTTPLGNEFTIQIEGVALEEGKGMLPYHLNFPLQIGAPTETSEPETTVPKRIRHCTEFL